MRARDLDRVNACGLLDAAYAEGQLGADEYRERTASAAGAKTIGALNRLVGDLQIPAAARDLAPHRPAVTRTPLRRPGAGYPPRTRARSADRAATSQLLDLAHGDGQLTEQEHGALTERAAAARTLGELAELVADLQRPAAAAPAPRPPRSRRRQWYLAALTTAAMLAAWAGYYLTGRMTDTPPPHQPIAAFAELGAVPPRVIETPVLASEAGVRQFLRDYQAKFGDLQADELTLHHEHGSVARAVPGQPNRLIKYDYRGGFAQSGEIGTRKSDTPVVDLATLNIPGLAAILSAAPDQLKVPGGKVSHLTVDINDHDGYRQFGIGRGAPVVSVYVSNGYGESGHLLADFAGRVARAWPFQG